MGKLLYTKEQMPQKEIAEKVGVTPQTVNRWVKKENWEQLRISLSVTREEQLRHLYSHLSEINASIANRPEGERFPNAKGGHHLRSRALSISWSERVVWVSGGDAFSQLVRWLRDTNLEEAQRITPILDDYVAVRLRQV